MAPTNEEVETALFPADRCAEARGIGSVQCAQYKQNNKRMLRARPRHPWTTAGSAPGQQGLGASKPPAPRCNRLDGFPRRETSMRGLIRLQRGMQFWRNTCLGDANHPSQKPPITSATKSAPVGLATDRHRSQGQRHDCRHRLLPILSPSRTSRPRVRL